MKQIINKNLLIFTVIIIMGGIINSITIKYKYFFKTGILFKLHLKLI
jgi:hypothetical protein